MAEDYFPRSLLLEPKIFIYRILKHLAKQENVMVFLWELFYTLDDRTCPVKDQLLQSIPLIQECEHELLHGLPWLVIGEALLIILMFGCDYFKDKVPGLSEVEDFLGVLSWYGDVSSVSATWQLLCLIELDVGWGWVIWCWCRGQ